MMSPHDLNSNVTYLVFGDEAYANLTQPNLETNSVFGRVTQKLSLMNVQRDIT